MKAPPCHCTRRLPNAAHGHDPPHDRMPSLLSFTIIHFHRSSMLMPILLCNVLLGIVGCCVVVCIVVCALYIVIVIYPNKNYSPYYYYIIIISQCSLIAHCLSLPSKLYHASIIIKRHMFWLSFIYIKTNNTTLIVSSR
jgi:hypothetical protein